MWESEKEILRVVNEFKKREAISINEFDELLEAIWKLSAKLKEVSLSRDLWKQKYDEIRQMARGST